MIDLSGSAKALVAGETVPMMRGGTPIASYECDTCRAILARAPKSLNPTITYLYALLVYPLEYNKPPIMYIVAEKARLSKAVLASMPSELRDMAEQSIRGDAFLCAFTEEGKFNLGSRRDLDLVETFEAEALKVMRDALKISGQIRKLNDTRRSGIFSEGRPGSGCLVVICTAPLLGYAIVELITALST